MVFWCRIKQSQLRGLSTQIRRCYFQINGPNVVNCTAQHSRELFQTSSVISSTQFKLRNHVRFFAIPIQKKEDKDTSGPRLNEKITSEYVRLVTDKGHNVVSRSEALDCARRLKLDLVEVDRNAKPPVCKLMDYCKEIYLQQIKEKDRAKSKSDLVLRKGDCKEVRICGKIEQKDLQMKANMVRKLMESGYRVKCMAIASKDHITDPKDGDKGSKDRNKGSKKQDKGSKDPSKGSKDQDTVFKEDLGGYLSRLFPLIEDISVVESGPRIEKKQAHVIVRHIKFGPPKKGSAKKDFQFVGAAAQGSTGSQEKSDNAESCCETENDSILFSPSSKTSKKESRVAWSVANEGNEFSEVFDIGNELKRAPAVSSSPTHAKCGQGSEPQFTNQERLPQVGRSTLAPARGSNQSENQSSSSINSKVPGDEIQYNSSSTPTPCFGIFSAAEVDNTAGKQSVGMGINRYKKGSPLDSTRRPGPMNVSANGNTSSSSGSRRPSS